MTTTRTELDRLLFGDNQFFGVNHMSEEKARSAADALPGPRRRHGRARRRLRRRHHAPSCARPTTGSPRSATSVRADPTRYAACSSSRACPTRTSTPTRSPRTGSSARCAGSSPRGLARQRDPRHAVAWPARTSRASPRCSIDAEMKMFNGSVDAGHLAPERRRRPAARPGLQRCLRDLRRPRPQRYGAEPGFITMNLPLLLDALDARRRRATRSCAPTSTSSVSACPAASTATCDALRSATVPGGGDVGVRRRARSRPGGDRVGLRLPNIESIVFGASSRANIAVHARAGRRVLARPPDQYRRRRSRRDPIGVSATISPCSVWGRTPAAERTPSGGGNVRGEFGFVQGAPRRRPSPTATRASPAVRSRRLGWSRGGPSRPPRSPGARQLGLDDDVAERLAQTKAPARLRPLEHCADWRDVPEEGHRARRIGSFGAIPQLGLEPLVTREYGPTKLEMYVAARGS